MVISGEEGEYRDGAVEAQTIGCKMGVKGILYNTGDIAHYFVIIGNGK